MSNKFEDWDSVDLDENVEEEEMVDEVVLKAFENPSLEDLEQQYMNGNYSYANVQNNNSYYNEDEEDGVIENNEPETKDPRDLGWPDNSNVPEEPKKRFKIDKQFIPFIIIAVLCLFAIACVGIAAISRIPQKPETCVTHIDKNNDGYCDKCSDRVKAPNVHYHAYSAATCDTPGLCSCGDIMGEPLGHEWLPATCSRQETCMRCNKVQGKYGEHKYANGSCEEVAECIYCGRKSYENYGHDWRRNTCDDYEVCSKCNKTGKGPTAHQYSNGFCIVCGMEDNSHQHVYDNACDPRCNVCSEVRNVPDHVYSNANDATCNECGFTRDLSHVHEYTDACDATCNACGEKRDAPHVFDDLYDFVCNNCGLNLEEHQHEFVRGECECGEIDPDYVAELDAKSAEMLALLAELMQNMPKNYAISNIQMNEAMKSLGLVPEYYEVIVDGNNRLIKNNETNWQYILSLEDGVYTIITENGEVIDISLETNTPDMGLGDTAEMPEITGDDIYYDEERGVYVISSELLLYALFSNMDMEDDDTFYIAFLLSMLLGDAEHTLKVEQGLIPGITVTSTLQTGFEILNLNVKPSFTGVTANIILNLSPLFNGMDDMIITTNLTYTVIDNDNGRLSVIVSMPDENGTIDATYSSDVRINQDPIVITTQMQEAIDGINNDIDTIIQKKYPGYQFPELDDCDCDYATIYDEELDLYITFNLSFKVNGYAFVDHYSKTLNSVEHCYVTLDEDGNFVSVEHALLETITDVIIEKYQGEFYCTNFCGGDIVVYDEEYGVYVVFDRDFWNKDAFIVEDFLTTVKAAPAADECVAQIDFDAKTLTLVEHSDACEYCNSLVDIEFTAIGFDDCDSLVVDIGNECFVQFAEEENGKFVVIDFGCVTFWNACECTIDVANATLTVIEHDH